MRNNGRPAAQDEQERGSGTAAVSRSFGAGEAVYRQGDEGDVLFVIQAGEVELRTATDDAPWDAEVLERLGPGDTFGEMTVIRGSRREATAVVTRDAKLLVIDAPTYSQMVRDNAEIASRIIRRLAGRLDDTTRRAQRYRGSSEHQPVGAGAGEAWIEGGGASRPPWVAATGLSLPARDDEPASERRVDNPTVRLRRKRALRRLILAAALVCAAIVWRIITSRDPSQPTLAGAGGTIADTSLGTASSSAAPPGAEPLPATAPAPAAPSALDPAGPSATPASAPEVDPAVASVTPAPGVTAAAATPPADARQRLFRPGARVRRSRRGGRTPSTPAVSATTATLRIEAEVAGTVEVDGLSRGPAPIVVSVSAGMHTLSFTPTADPGAKLNRRIMAGAGIETVVIFPRPRRDAPDVRPAVSQPDEPGTGGPDDEPGTRGPGGGSPTGAALDAVAGSGGGSNAALRDRTRRTDNKDPWRK